MIWLSRRHLTAHFVVVSKGVAGTVVVVKRMDWKSDGWNGKFRSQTDRKEVEGATVRKNFVCTRAEEIPR